MDKIRRNLLAGGSAALLATSLTGCGTLLYPERKGQGSGGRLDPSILILDGIGLLMFLVPGIIAFAVDFGNDTIYLPRSRADASDVIKVTRTAQLSKPEIDRIWNETYGEDAPFELSQVRREQLHTGTDVPATLSASARNNYAPV
ncbi:MAG: hypothetical protein VR75_15275 [Hyphomonadaceae bacterium BRH_c29]|jgi:hypothetical protein|nr:MAG: hypothetical protein VR75_15275 [Hyphomonadaceae bacterium BRH_c29]